MEQLKQLMSYIKEKPDARLRSYGNRGLNDDEKTDGDDGDEEIVKRVIS